MDNNFWKKFRVGIFMGGPSSEHEVSLASGKAVYKALKEEGLDAIPIILPRNLDTAYVDIANLLNQILEEQDIDLVFNSLHGRFGEDGQLQQILDNLGIAYTGSGAKTTALAMDKVSSRKLFERINIPQPRYVVLAHPEISNFSRKYFCPKLTFPFPAVVKPARGGSSIGVSIVEKAEYLGDAVRLAFTYDERIIIEEYISGDEITVGILDDEPLPVIQIVPQEKFYNYKAKYQDDKTQYLIPAPIDMSLQEEARMQALKAHRGLGCISFSRVDMVLSREGVPFVLEVNTIPGLTSHSLLPKAAKAIHISFNQLCLIMLESASDKKHMPSHAGIS
jgi:D-alanine-D-alanine ligase